MSGKLRLDNFQDMCHGRYNRRKFQERYQIMGKYNFDEIVDRKNTWSLKYDIAIEKGKSEDTIPLWVADMDFKAPPCVISALSKRLAHGIFGYSDSGQDYFDVLENWFYRRFQWKIRPEWLVKTPGIVFAICNAVRAFTEKGDAVLIQQPVYPPFSWSVKVNDRKLVVNELVYSNGRYTIDFDDFEKKIVENNVKLFILCSPHNPVGRVWKREELLRLGEICLKHGVLILSDEIHADFVYGENKHTVFATLAEEFAGSSVTFTSPTKTFNIAGLQISNVFIQNERLRIRFEKEVSISGYGEANIMGMEACKAAYSEGYEWLLELREYLTGNVDFVREFLLRNVPEIKLVEPEGTYLLWLDFRGLGLSDDELDDLLINRAKLLLDPGRKFGDAGRGFQRLNIGCPRQTLRTAMQRLAEAVKAR